MTVTWIEEEPVGVSGTPVVYGVNTPAQDKNTLGAAFELATSGVVPALVVVGILGLALYGFGKFMQREGFAENSLEANPRRKRTKLDELKEELPPGFYVATYSPGDGVTRYRFFNKAGNSYFGPDNGIYTALGYKEAYTYARGLQRLEENPRRSSERRVQWGQWARATARRRNRRRRRKRPVTRRRVRVRRRRR